MDRTFFVPTILLLSVLFLFGCKGRQAELEPVAPYGTGYYYYTLVGSRLTVRDPGKRITVTFEDRKDRSRVKRTIRKLDLKVIYEGEFREETGPWFYVVEGKREALNRYEDNRLELLRRVPEISVAGFILNLEFITDRYASYSGVLEIQFQEAEQEIGLKPVLERLKLEKISLTKGNIWHSLRVQCPGNAGTEKINELIELLMESDSELKVSPEYDNVFSRVILEGP